MHMVQFVLLFIKAVQTADWDLHLSSLEAFTKYFFAYDKLNYARMIPLYLAEMKALKHTDPLVWEEFQNGNWVVNKTSIPFCAIRADHALILTTLSLLIIKDLRSSFLIFTPKNTQFLKPQNLLQLLLISICFSREIEARI